VGPSPPRAALAAAEDGGGGGPGPSSTRSAAGEEGVTLAVLRGLQDEQGDRGGVGGVCCTALQWGPLLALDQLSAGGGRGGGYWLLHDAVVVVGRISIRIIIVAGAAAADLEFQRRHDQD